MKAVFLEKVLKGIPMSPGVGIGLPVFLKRGKVFLDEKILDAESIQGEIENYQSALSKSKNDLTRLKRESSKEGQTEVFQILTVHLEILNDPMLNSGMIEKIKKSKMRAEVLISQLLDEYENRFRSVQDEFFKERLRDLVDISRRITVHLKGQPQKEPFPKGSILFAQELIPTDTMEANLSTIHAFVSKVGGTTSHAAIIARAKGIPFVANIDFDLIEESSVESLIVDGGKGEVILNPSRETREKYISLKNEIETQKLASHSLKDFKAETIDGAPVRLFANVESFSEIKNVIESGGEGIGLFRSEYLCFEKNRLPSEEEQFIAYKKMAEALENKPFVVRLFDLGGDKKLDSLCPEASKDMLFEPNPALGYRGIRLLLKHPDIFDAQIRAIVRASHFGNIHLLVPMVSDFFELKKVQEKIEQIQKELKIQKKIPLGCMIEVPSSALMSDVILEVVDFISIGTNDLLQFLMAKDRASLTENESFCRAHPSILRLIKMVITEAHLAKKSVFLCGEMAADPLLIPIFMGLGIFEFSVSSQNLNSVKEIVRKWSIIEANRFAQGALSFTSAGELEAYLKEERPTY